MPTHHGGCLCNAVQYEVDGDPLWVTVCYCRFCQKSTGSDHMVEPIFDIGKLTFTADRPARFTLSSAGSGHDVHVHFCAACGTKLALTFARWPDRIGVFAGSFDDPAWFPVTPDNTKHIFVSEAVRGTVIPAGFRVFERHATENDGTPLTPAVYDVPRVIG